MRIVESCSIFGLHQNSARVLRSASRVGTFPQQVCVAMKKMKGFSPQVTFVSQSFSGVKIPTKYVGMYHLGQFELVLVYWVLQ